MFQPNPAAYGGFFPNQIEYHKHVLHYDAFPSGHICTAVGTVVVIAENYPEQKWIRPVGFVIAGLVGIGMVNYSIHWHSDYPLGIAMGYTFGMLVAHPEKAEFANSSAGAKLSVLPYAQPDGAGLTLTLKF